MIYVPTINSNTCYYFDNNNTIVELPSTYETNQTYNVKHISIDNHYQTYYKNKTITEQVNCLDNSLLTTNYYYRSDIVDILFFFIFIAICIIYIPYRFASRFWKWLR